MSYLVLEVDGTSTVLLEGGSGSVLLETPTTVNVGDHLQAVVGAWDNNPTSFTYEWKDSADGATGWADTVDQTGTGAASDFIIPPAEATKFLECLVTGTNIAGDSAQQTTDVVGPVQALLTGIWGVER